MDCGTQQRRAAGSRTGIASGMSVCHVVERWPRLAQRFAFTPPSTVPLPFQARGSLAALCHSLLIPPDSARQLLPWGNLPRAWQPSPTSRRRRGLGVDLEACHKVQARRAFILPYLQLWSFDTHSAPLAFPCVRVCGHELLCRCVIVPRLRPKRSIARKHACSMLNSVDSATGVWLVSLAHAACARVCDCVSSQICIALNYHGAKNQCPMITRASLPGGGIQQRQEEDR